MKKELLLFLPPCDASHRPGAALPQLAGYLERRGVSLGCLDANLAFFRHFFQEERLLSGLSEGAERLEELGSRRSLGFSEMMEYLSLAKGKMVLDMAGEDMVRRSLDPREILPGHVRSTLFESVAKFLWVSRFPESLWNVGEGIFYEAPGSCYSSGEILKCAEEEGIFEDFFASWLSRKLQGEDPRVMGISITYGGQVVPAFRMARELKKLFPRAFIVLGGAFVTLHLGRTENTELFRTVDGMILGDGEVPLERLWEVLVQSRGTLESVPGLLYLKEGTLRRNPPASPFPLEKITPAYGYFPKEGYYQDASGEFAGFRLSRGCSWGRCAFCRTEEEFIRHVALGGEELFEKVRSLVRDQGQRSFAFGDDEADPEMLEHFASWVCREKLNISWSERECSGGFPAYPGAVHAPSSGRMPPACDGGGKLQQSASGAYAQGDHLGAGGAGALQRLLGRDPPGGLYDGGLSLGDRRRGPKILRGSSGMHPPGHCAVRLLLRLSGGSGICGDAES